MRQIYLFALLLATPLSATAQIATPRSGHRSENAVVEESVTDVECFNPTHAITHFKEVTTILNEHAAHLATFVCSCSKNDKLTRFKGQVTDATGRVVRKFKESELKHTEYSQYLAIDDYRMFLDYTPPVYPVTITYEWTMESHNNLIEFPRFCPQTDYDVSVKKAVYRLKAPKELVIRHTMLNIDKEVTTSDEGKTLTLELDNLPALKKEPYARPLRDRLPMAYFVPTDFIYYGTKGSLSSWADYGKWEHSLINGREALPDNIRKEIHQMTDGLKTNREKVEALYHYLEKTTRYVAILLGIGGQQPAPASEVAKSGFGDCKGLSNYMRAMLKEIGISSHYTTISTYNRRLIPNFASVGQMNHVILQVPLPHDTLWMECTNPQLPLGYVHEDIAGHDAIVINAEGGRMMTLPVYADTANVLLSNIQLTIDAQGNADIQLNQTAEKWQYERYLPLLRMDEKERNNRLRQMMRVQQSTINKAEIGENEMATICLDATIRSQQYANVTGKRLFVPTHPLRRQYSIPADDGKRTEDLYISTGWTDVDSIVMQLPEGYHIEARPKDVCIEKPFGTFSFSVENTEGQLRISYRMTLKAGSYDKTLFPSFADFLRSATQTYGQKVVLVAD